MSTTASISMNWNSSLRRQDHAASRASRIAASSTAGFDDLLTFNSLQITETIPGGNFEALGPGYGLARAVESNREFDPPPLRQRRHAAGIFLAELKLSRSGRARRWLDFFASVAEALQAAGQLSDLKPARLSTLTVRSSDQTRGSAISKPVRICSISMPTMRSDFDRGIFLRVRRQAGHCRNTNSDCADDLKSVREQNLVWTMRKDRLSCS